MSKSHQPINNAHFFSSSSRLQPYQYRTAEKKSSPLRAGKHLLSSPPPRHPVPPPFRSRVNTNLKTVNRDGLTALRIKDVAEKKSVWRDAMRRAQENLQQHTCVFFYKALAGKTRLSARLQTLLYSIAQHVWKTNRASILLFVFFFLALSLFVCLFVRLLVCVSVCCLFSCLSICVFVCLFVRSLFVVLFNCLLFACLIVCSLVVWLVCIFVCCSCGV